MSRASSVLTAGPGMLAALMVLPAAAGAQARPARYLSPLERAIVAEHNRVRANPARYADYLEEQLQYFDGKLLRLPGRIAEQTKEGKKAMVEAIRYLRAAPRLPPLRPSRGMSLGARDHVRDQGPDGRTGHTGSDGTHPWDRVNRYGAWSGEVGENISYGPDTARDVVLQLIVDDGVKDRGHRKNIFHEGFQVMGVACGPHKEYRHMCVVTYAAGYAEK